MCRPVGNEGLALTRHNLVSCYPKASSPAQEDASAAQAPRLKPQFQDELQGFRRSRGRFHHSATILTEEKKNTQEHEKEHEKEAMSIICMWRCGSGDRGWLLTLVASQSASQPAAEGLSSSLIASQNT